MTSQKLFRARLLEGVNNTSAVGIFAAPATVSPYPNLASRPQGANGVDGDLCLIFIHRQLWRLGEMVRLQSWL